MKFLIVEDEESLRKSINEYLTTQENICDHASTHEQGYLGLASGLPHPMAYLGGSTSTCWN